VETRWRERFGPAHPKILAWRPYARPLAGFKGGREREREERNGKGE